MKNRLDIYWNDDEYECEDCGAMWSTGATVVYNGVVIMDAPASAHCFHCVNVEEGHILKKLCNYLDIEVHGLDGMYNHTGAEGDEWPSSGNC